MSSYFLVEYDPQCGSELMFASYMFAAVIKSPTSKLCNCHEDQAVIGASPLGLDFSAVLPGIKQPILLGEYENHFFW